MTKEEIIKLINKRWWLSVFYVQEDEDKIMIHVRVPWTAQAYFWFRKWARRVFLGE